MSEADQQIDELERRLDELVRTQIDFQKEITLIRSQIRNMRSASTRTRADQSFYVPPETPKAEPRVEAPQAEEPVRQRPPIRETQKYSEPGYRPASAPNFGYSARETSKPNQPDFVSEFFDKYTASARADLEKFIGENLISKIGILILIIGIGIGVKYSIDNNLISPLTRVILGYIFGFGLVGLAIKLKSKYHNFSAVLISGGMAAMYFVTYFGYSLYGLLPQMAAFGLMVLFTLLTVGAALIYNRLVVAHIGLVGAYAVPFLLSDDSGNYLFLFGYLSILNTGIMTVLLKKRWISLFYNASIFTWLIYLGWFASKFRADEHFYLAVSFLAVFFAMFYATRILLIDKDAGATVESLVSTLATTFIFLSFCLGISTALRSLDQTAAMFAYLATAGALILLTSYSYFGRSFLYLVGPFSWLIFAARYFDRFDVDRHTLLALVFAFAFFLMSYGAAFAYRLLGSSFGFIENAGVIISNSFIFYGFSYSIFDSGETTRNYLGVLTVCHGLFHLAAAQLISRLRPSAVDVVQVLAILILTFASIAIPVQFDGHVVTLVWVVEAALLFGIGRSRSVKLFEYFSYPVMVLACLSLAADWMLFRGEPWRPIANGQLVTAMVFVAAFAIIYFVNREEEYVPAVPGELTKALGYAFAAIAVFVFYNAFRLEIVNYFDLKAAVIDLSSGDSEMYRRYFDVKKVGTAWQINYTLFFLSAMGLINQLRLRSKLVALANCSLSGLVLFLFATVQMALFHELRTTYLDPGTELGDVTNVAIRYISYVFAAGMLVVLYRYVRDELLDDVIAENSRVLIFETVFYCFTFIVGSCELVNLMAQFQIADATKLGLSIFWGFFALAMVVAGIAWDKKHLRIAAMALLGVTLAKLFFYDITELGTIPKTILFITLGMTLLVISFLYNKYKAIIFPNLAASHPEVPEGSVTDA